MTYADVIIDISHEALNKSFQYIVPKDMELTVNVGSVVTVPFGRGNSPQRAYVVGLSGTPKIEENKLKEILNIDEKDESIEGKLLTLAGWMSKTYGATVASCLRTVLPVAKKAALPLKKSVCLALSIEESRGYLLELCKKKRHSVAKERLISALLEEEEIPWEFITGKLNIDSSVIRDLQKRGVVLVNTKETHVSVKNKLGIEKKNVTLNPEQKQAVDTFVSDWESGYRGGYLIHGVTGSGKTEVYIRILERVIKDGLDAIVLIPEIALTYQTLMRFYHHFGDMVSVMNSRLTPAERYDIFNRAKNGEIRIIIGPRSALFTPFKNLGVIVIDEEHESSYKSEKMPRYHARECAFERARLSGASVVLGSATPSIESFYSAKSGKIKLLTLKNRAGAANLPQTEVVDLRNELKSGNRSILSRRLQELIKENLIKNKQTMLFLNRRGMLASLSCRACGEVIKCPHCDVSLSLHRDKRLYCHYCGYSEVSPQVCPSCKSPYLGGFKAGTEKIEEEVKRLFPDAGVLRMDADSTKGKEGHEKILSVFANRGADILIGTQMIVKGHDFPDVSLVGILAADMSLNVGDFRSAERTFDLICQAAGRAGRGDTPGRVIIQTYRPEHYAVSLAANQDYLSFYEKEISFRGLLGYPPKGHMLLCMLLSRKEEKVNALGEKIQRALLEFCGQESQVASSFSKKPWMSKVIKPSVSKIQDVYRRMIYFKSKDLEDLVIIREKIDEVSVGESNVSVYYDTDPLNM